MNDKMLSYTRLLLKAYSEFIKFYSIDPTGVYIDTVILCDICKRYFRDVDRLHQYHGIANIDAHKIAGYTTYWISKLKPISIVDKKLYSYSSEFCLYINELFAIYVSTGRLISASRFATTIRLSSSFLSSFVYTIKYRITTGDNLSMIYYFIETN